MYQVGIKQWYVMRVFSIRVHSLEMKMKMQMHYVPVFDIDFVHMVHVIVIVAETVAETDVLLFAHCYIHYFGVVFGAHLKRIDHVHYK